MNLLDLARSALEPALKRSASPTEATELRRLLNVILADEPDEIEESLAIACADPDDALICFRTLVAEGVGRTDLNNGESTNGI